MKKSLKISLIVLLFLVIIFAGLSVYFIAKSTANPEVINTNTAIQNDPVSTTQATTTVAAVTEKDTKPVMQELIVPDEFKIGVFEEPRFLNLPTNFKISLWAKGVTNPRQIDWTASGNMIVADRGSSSIKIFKPSADGKTATESAVVEADLNQPSGVDYYNGDLYVGTADAIYVYKDLKDDGTYSSKNALITDIPTDGHWTRTVKVGPDQKLYVTIGSSCNLCEETDERRAAMLVANIDGTDARVYSSGLRNTVDFVFKKTSNTDFKIWGVDNGRDEIGDDIPPEEVNILQDGKNYGWPYCYGNAISNPEYPERSGYCKTETQPVTYGLQAHSAPLGLTFLVNDNLTQRVKFPQEAFKDDLFISYHGSWNRSIPTGYKIVRINTIQTDSKETDFISGWLAAGEHDPWGRPVDVKFDKNGDMFITDDAANAVYKVQYIGGQ